MVSLSFQNIMKNLKKKKRKLKKEFKKLYEKNKKYWALKVH